MTTNVPASGNNPATGGLKLPKGYRPLSNGQSRLEVPQIEGFVLRWFRGDPNRIQRALQAGYQFVDKDEADLNDFDIAGGDTEKGTDLGSRVSVISGDDVGPAGQPGRMYLMKCPIDLYQYARSLHGNKVDSTVQALKGTVPGNVREGGESKADVDKRYVKQINAPLLTKKST